MCLSKNLMNYHVSLHILPLLSLFTLALHAQAPVAAAAPVEMITPAQWLQRQPKPMFKAGHTLPRLTRYAYDLSVETQTVFAEDWHYTLQTNYLSDARVADALKDPTNHDARLIALTKSDPKKYPLAVTADRNEPVNPDPATFLRDAEGNLINGSTYSPLNPQSTLDQMAELRARPIRELLKKVPISIVLNAGEYGLGVPGFMRDIAARDPKVAAAQTASGLDWISFISKGKKREMDTIRSTVKKAAPEALYIYYATGPTGRNSYWGWRDWGTDPEDALEGSDLPSSEHYYKHFNSGYLSVPGVHVDSDLLSRALNATGFQIKHGQKYSYDWLWAGAADEADPNAPPVAAPTAAPKAPSLPQFQEGNAAALVDPTASELSPVDLYTGFLKCIFTAGTLGGNAGYYKLPGGGFNGTFPADKPKHYLPQMTALSQVQAMFSHLESDVRDSDLLPGPNKHAKSTDQPAYEFPTGYVNTRVLARKHNTQVKWLLTAWAADGVERPVKVIIPELGEIALLARAAGSVYTVTLKEKKPLLMLNDANAMLPTVKGFAPRAVTEAQILARVPKAPTAPLRNNLQMWFDASKGVEKDKDDGVTSWKPGGTLAKWQVNARADGKKPLWVAEAANGLPAVRLRVREKAYSATNSIPNRPLAGL